MHAPTIFAILSFAFAATATPIGIEPNGNALCGNGQVVSCCNTNSVSSGAGGLLGSGGILDGVLGGSCSPLTIPIRKFWYPSHISNRIDGQMVAFGIALDHACGNKLAVACCTGDQDVSTPV